MLTISMLAALAVCARYAFAVVVTVAIVNWACGEQTRARRRAHRLRRERYLRAEHRESRLEQAGVPRTEMDELTTLVDLVYRIAPEADHHELHALLDDYAEASVAAHLAAAPLRAGLPHARRGRGWRIRASALAERRDEIAQLIRLDAALATIPAENPLRTDEAITRRLALLDEPCDQNVKIAAPQV